MEQQQQPEEKPIVYPKTGRKRENISRFLSRILTTQDLSAYLSESLDVLL